MWGIRTVSCKQCKFLITLMSYAWSITFAQQLKRKSFTSIWCLNMCQKLFTVLLHYNKMNQRMPLIYVKLYTYQVWFCNFASTFQHNSTFVLISIILWTCFIELNLQICRALAYMHNCVGVCHRDIKPQNILVLHVVILFKVITETFCLGLLMFWWFDIGYLL